MLAVGIVAVGTVLLAYQASRISPAWAMRYLAVAVPPLLLLCAAGLAAARGIGLLTLGIVSILWAYDLWPPTKSNVRQVTTAIAPSLSPGDVVVSTQPEQVPVLHHYLPKGLRYATLTGFGRRRRGHRLARRRQAAARDARRSATSQPLLDGLAPGRRLVLVTPIIFDEDRWLAPWTELVRVRSKECRQYVSNDPPLSADVGVPADADQAASPTR